MHRQFQNDFAQSFNSIEVLCQLNFLRRSMGIDPAALAAEETFAWLADWHHCLQ